ncbi:MAG TPA: glucan biosynthesis protein [Opitutaceae bacterium]|nr:glucan biosynthesis protein [Opitutaceae bacterium]
MMIRFLWVMLALAGGRLGAEVNRVEINHAYVRAIAEKTAAAPYHARPSDLPPFLRDLSYDDYQRIQFRHDSALWRSDQRPFTVEFFHPGSIHSRPVAINEFTGGYTQHIPFVRTFFDYADLHLGGRLPSTLEYAGFRLLFHLEDPQRWDEVVAFLGASYFRGLAKGQRYGSSARGLALNAGGPGTEEFPDFTEFWLGKPEPGASTITFHALLDSPSVAGAYTFVLTPGSETVMEVHVSLFFRSRVENVGLAPLTSMFWFGENSANHFGDFRGEVHDSDGLLVAPEDGVRWWRPLANPPQVRISDFSAAAIAGFGLLQRDRVFHDYEDSEARYERRPGAWVEPVGPWPPGRVRLLELPAKNEYDDNIVASWNLVTPPEPGHPLEYSYRLHWTNAATFGGPAGWVSSTRQTVQVDRAGRTKFVIDFDPAGPRAIPASANVTADLDLPREVTLLDQRVFRNEADGSWRLALLLDGPAGGHPVELRARLLLEGKPLTETWVNTWQP